MFFFSGSSTLDVDPTARVTWAALLRFAGFATTARAGRDENGTVRSKGSNLKLFFRQQKNYILNNRWLNEHVANNLDYKYRRRFFI